jgi:P4 family phage/plasmid primase-like protien
MSATPLDIALVYIARGIAPIPVPHRAKGAVIPGWPELRINEATAGQYFNGALMNVGGLMGEPSGGLTDLDLDCEEARLAAKAFLPSTDSMSGRDGSPRSHWFYACPGAESKPYLDPETGETLLEIRSTGCMTILPGSTHPSGELVRWFLDGQPAEVPAEDLTGSAGRLAAAALLLRLAPDKGRHFVLRDVGNLLAARASKEDALAFLEPLAKLLRRGEGGNPVAEVRRIVDNAIKRRDEGKPVSGWRRFVESLGRKRAEAITEWLSIDGGGGGGGEGLSHDALALEFGAEMDGDAKHVDLWGRWLFYRDDAKVWRIDETRMHETYVREFLRDKAEQLVRWAEKRLKEAEKASKAAIAAYEANRTPENTTAASEAAAAFKAAEKLVGWAKEQEQRLRSARMMADVIGMARSNTEIAATVDLWDRGPWLLGTPDGTVDLRTGELRPSRREDFITKRTTVAPAGSGTPTPIWDKFLDRIFQHDPELVGFAKRFLGYCLTGFTVEHALVFAWGMGGNGKSVLFGTVNGVMGDYAAVLPTIMLMVNYNEPHPTTIAGLRGARLVTAQEVPPGKAWDETKLKELTGGDKLKARFMHQDEFEYVPQFKLIVSGNNKPSFRRVDEAIKRRVNLVPFLQNIPKEERDPQLAEKLKAEWPAILRWLIDGCLEWQREGLKVPASVRAASASYMASEDVLMLWVEERCVVGPKVPFTPIKDLYEDWAKWREEGGHKHQTSTMFGKDLEEKGFSRHKGSGGARGFKGIRLKTPEEWAKEAAEAEKPTDPDEASPVGGEPRSNPTSDQATSGRSGESGRFSWLDPLAESSDGSDSPPACYLRENATSATSATRNVAFRHVTTAEEARRVVAELAERGMPVGLDLETTGLDPLTAKPRLLQLAPADGPVVIVDLFQAGGLEALRDVLPGVRGTAHNAAFDMAFLRHNGVRSTLDCTLIASHMLTGKREKLSEVAERHLGVRLDKAEQKSDWSGELTEAQLHYAAADAAVLVPLFDALRDKLGREASLRVYELARDAQPAVVAMRLRGMPFDAEAHGTLMVKLTAERDRLAHALGEALAGRNPGSADQLGNWLTWAMGGKDSAAFRSWPKTGGGKLSTSTEALAKGLGLLPPDKACLVRDLLLPFKVVEKQVSAFGASYVEHLHPLTGRIHADFKLAATVAGRMSCSDPNLQQVPRDGAFRALFRAPEGRRFVIADYSQVELRVAAMRAGEAKMLAAFAEGRDVHRLTAGMILGKPAEAIDKAERQLAKAVNFGLLYGQGAKGLQGYAAKSYGVEITLAEATRHREAWFDAYPAFRRWHTRSEREARKTLSVRTPAGRVRRWSSRDYDAENGFRATEAYNTPVQGGAAEAMLAALGRLTRRLDSAGLDAMPIAVVHDEVILEASEADAPEAARILEECMVAGMLDVFPDATIQGLVEAHIGKSWADK